MWDIHACECINRDAVEAHSCVDAGTEISFDEQCTTVDKYSIAGYFDRRSLSTAYK